ncbi:MAG: acetolactate synthase large subunit, partial [Gammaproteobacteria bacterium]|nr:acetolactate synthase large subunit [Gammaproteobacteria bacterium]
MNGAESLIKSLVKAGVNVCFANPGTSEMHLVQAIDTVPEMRPVLALFEGVCTGAADGYGRMTGKPAMTLLHLGPGFANGIANLHNARRADSPIINVVGNHPAYHIKFDAPLTSDIDTLARNVSSWIKADSTSISLAEDGMKALSASLTSRAGSEGCISTLITPADACWGPASGLSEKLPVPEKPKVDEQLILQVRERLNEHSILLLDGEGLTQRALQAANRVARVTGCKVFIDTFPSRVEGGAGTAAINRMPYFPEHVMAALKGVATLILAGARSPSSFFAYPDTPGDLVPENCETIKLAGKNEDIIN